jgi:hypothetical protein
MVRPTGYDEEPVMEDMWTMKKQLPDFMGTDPVGWITAAERFFEKNEVPSRDKLQWAFMSMEDEQAMMWFYYWCEENPDADWKSFSMAMIRKFGAPMESSASKVTLQNQETESKPLNVTETHDDPTKEESSTMKVIEASTEGGNEAQVKESELESETIANVIAEKLEASNNRLSVKKMNEVHRGVEQVISLEPPPEPPDLSVSDQPLVALPWRRPQPKPPEMNKYVDVNGSMVKLPSPSVSPVPDSSVSIVGSASKRSSMTRTKLVEKEDRRVESVFGNLSPILSLMGQAQTDCHLPGQKERVHVNLIHGLNPLGPIQVTFSGKPESQTRCFLWQSIACALQLQSPSRLMVQVVPPVGVLSICSFCDTYHGLTILRSGSPEPLDGEQFAKVPPKPPDPNLFVTVGHIQKILNLVATTQLREIVQLAVPSPTPGSSTSVLSVKIVAWLSKEKGENRNYYHFDIEVLITKALLVGERIFPKSIGWNSFLSGCAQQERYVEVFKHFINMQYVDSPLLLNENVTHGCVVRICVNGDGLVPNINDKGYGEKGYFDFALKMMFLNSEDIKWGILTWVFLNLVLSPKHIEIRITLITCVLYEKYFEGLSKVKTYILNGSLKENFSVSDNSFCKTSKYAIDCKLDHIANDGNAHNGQQINLLLTWFDFLVMDSTQPYICSVLVTSVLLLCEFTKDYGILFPLGGGVGLASWVSPMTNQAKKSDAHNKTNQASGYSSILQAEHNDDDTWRQSSEGNGLRVLRISPKHHRILSCSFTNVGEILQTGICVLAFGIWPFTQLVGDNTTLCKRSMLVGDLYAPRLMIGWNHPILLVVNGNTLISLNSEAGCCSCETVHVTWLFEGGLSSVQQRDLRGNDLILNYYCTKRALMPMVARVVLLVIKFLEREKEYITSNAPMIVTTVLNSSTMAIPWDPGKFNALMLLAAYEYCRRIAFISQGDGIHIVAEPYDLALWNTMIRGYESKGNLVHSFIIMSWHSSFWVKQQDLIEVNFSMVVAAVYKVCWGLLSTFHGLLNFVFDRGKTREMRGPLQGWLLRSFVALMSQVEVCQQRNCLGLIEKGIWFLIILVKLLSILSSLNKFIPSWLSDNLMTLLVVRRVIIITSNLEVKVDYKGVALIGPMII